MYVKRVQLINYGPIEELDIALAFEGDTPKPVLLVGENGSGKSILLSHIVNGLISAKDLIYPESSEVEKGKVYKIRDNSYIKTASECYFGRIEFQDGQNCTEMRAQRPKKEYESIPLESSAPYALNAWEKMKPDENDYFDSSFSQNNTRNVEAIFAKNCILYFPPNRFEEPAWLNKESLNAQAHYMDVKHIKGYTDRRVINYSSLHYNKNWLFDLVFDRAVFELQTPTLNLPTSDANSPIPISIVAGYSGQAARIYETALQVVRAITNRKDARFGIGRRINRIVSLESDRTGQIVPNIFQLSSGETSLMNLFLSILRDFDLCGTPFSSPDEIRGIVLVDEIDLHLHAVHQHEVLPKLVRMFPKVQFIVTTHSPLFVLGMQKTLPEDGFALYRLPDGHQISPEEFSEFGHAYESFTETHRYTGEISAAIEHLRNPIILLEGTTDEKYLRRAASLLDKNPIIQRIELRDGGGHGNMDNLWKYFKHPLTDIFPQKVLLLFDCDRMKPNGAKGNLLRRTVPFQADNPLLNGIENLFQKSTIQKAQLQNPSFFDIECKHTRMVGGEPQEIPEKWTINEREKKNLCKWLCENGTREDFKQFQLIFDLIEDALDFAPSDRPDSE